MLIEMIHVPIAYHDASPVDVLLIHETLVDRSHVV
jgi:hypothetical protein